jgi:hypothetical protein
MYRGIIPCGIIVECRAELFLEGLQRTGSRFPRSLVVEHIGIVCNARNGSQDHHSDDRDDDGEGQQHARDGRVPAYPQGLIFLPD